jgi:hypothetical protein
MNAANATADAALAVDANSTTRRSRASTRSRLGACVVAGAIILAGGSWYCFGRSPSGSAGATVSQCSRALSSVDRSSTENLVPAVVGTATSVGIAAFHTASGWRWCFAGMGTGTGPIERAALSEPVSAPIAVRDGGSGRDVLMLVHHDRYTESVVVDTARSRSVVLASASGFEVVLIPMASWPQWHTPWSRTPVPLGRILGFDREGQLTSSMPFTWCPGSIDVNPGLGC